MFFGYFEVFNEFPNSLNSCEDRVLSSEWMLSEENFKSSLILMLFCIKVAERAGKLIEVIVEYINVVSELSFHLIFRFF